jgi:hypothetical protein
LEQAFLIRHTVTIQMASASAEDKKTFNTTLKKPFEDWLSDKKGKVNQGILNDEFKAWQSLYSKNMYCGKGQKQAPFNKEEMGMIKIIVMNIPDTTYSWDIRELFSAFTPVLGLYRPSFSKDGETVFANNIRVTIPAAYNGRSVSDVLSDLIDGPIILNGKRLFFKIFRENYKPSGTNKPFKPYKGKTAAGGGGGAGSPVEDADSDEEDVKTITKAINKICDGDEDTSVDSEARPKPKWSKVVNRNNKKPDEAKPEATKPVATKTMKKDGGK